MTLSLGDIKKAALKAPGRGDLTPLDVCLGVLNDYCPGEDLLSAKISDEDEAHFLISSLYTLLIPSDQRRRQAAFFTPPPIVGHLLDQVVKAGVDLSSCRVLDPAAGGAAFLSSVAASMLHAGLSPEQTVGRLNGIEVDPALALLSREMLARRLGLPEVPKTVVKVADTLRLTPEPCYDLVLANPPYGRLFGHAAETKGAWADYVDPGHVNLYAIFVGLSIAYAKPGGVIGLVLPRSFISGSLFSSLRRHLRTKCDLISLDLIDKRKGVFLDVGQDICVLVARKLDQARTTFETGAVPCALLSLTEGAQTQEPVTLPTDPLAPWLLPAVGGACRGGTATIEDYGYTVRSGYFVWNREGARMRAEPSADAYPLVWAHNIKAGKPCVPVSKTRADAVDYVHFQEPGSGIIRNPSVVLQRTTNGKQPRRLIPAVVDPSIVAAHGGFVAENHVIVVFSNREGAAEPELMAKLLGSLEVDRRYRRVAGGSNISTLLLRGLALPHPDILAKVVAETLDFDEAVVKAYEQDQGENPEERSITNGLHQGSDGADEAGDGGSPGSPAGQCGPPQEGQGRAAAE